MRFSILLFLSSVSAMTFVAYPNDNCADGNAGAMVEIPGAGDSRCIKTDDQHSFRIFYRPGFDTATGARVVICEEEGCGNAGNGVTIDAQIGACYPVNTGRNWRSALVSPIFVSFNTDVLPVIYADSRSSKVTESGRKPTRRDSTIINKASLFTATVRAAFDHQPAGFIDSHV